jgi:methylphosphotriester-DNA--protein-cysteine methyltransferase
LNTKLNLGFSQYLRQQRIDEAKELLVSQPKASVLTIGLEVGFSSQSNFYEAFKEIAGTTPAKFRKLSKD